MIVSTVCILYYVCYDCILFHEKFFHYWTLLSIMIQPYSSTLSKKEWNGNLECDISVKFSFNLELDGCRKHLTFRRNQVVCSVLCILPRQEVTCKSYYSTTVEVKKHDEALDF